MIIIIIKRGGRGGFGDDDHTLIGFCSMCQTYLLDSRMPQKVAKEGFSIFSETQRAEVFFGLYSVHQTLFFKSKIKIKYRTFFHHKVGSLCFRGVKYTKNG